jgi:hypothetical protein
MRKFPVGIGIIVGTLAVLFVTAAPASALTKERTPIPLTENYRVVGSCEFPVILSDLSGQGTLTSVLDDQGNLVRIEIQGHFVTQITNELTGKSVTVNSAGPVTIIPQEDGTEFAIHHGQHILADQGLATGEPSLIYHVGTIVVHARFNPDTGFVDFISTESTGVTTDLCAELAGT